MAPKAHSVTPSVSDTPRAPWTAPRVEDLPRLTELTLQTGPLIEGTCSSGSTCF